MSFGRLFFPMRELLPILERQALLLSSSTELLSSMLETPDQARWKQLYSEIRSNEHKGDAMLTEFREQSARLPLGAGARRELTTISMALEDCLDVVKDAANALPIYKPAKIDSQLLDLSRIILEEARALGDIFPLLSDLRKSASAIVLLADRVKELEHDADEAYEEYIGHIFEQEPDLREMTKYKNLAELYEKATDSEKHVADCVRILLMRYVR